MSNDSGKFPELFGSMVFNEDTMKERLSPSCYKLPSIYRQQMK